MKIIQISVEEDTLQAVDRAAQADRVSRSAVFREAASRYLRERRIRELEEQQRQAYERVPDAPDEIDEFNEVIAWPDD